VCVYIYVYCWFYSNTIGIDGEDIHMVRDAFLVLTLLLAGPNLTYRTKFLSLL
jgi:hypothetical protein